MNPLISVIIPVYNGDQYLAKAIASVNRQNYAPIEIIIVDDGSTDMTSAIVAELSDREIIYVYQENGGAAQARNNGLNLAKGEFIAFLDVDDLWSDQKLEIQSSYLLKDPSLDIVFGKLQHLLLEVDTIGSKIYRELSHPNISVSLGVGLYRRSIFNKIGWLDPVLRQSEDLDFWLRIRESNLKTISINHTVYYYHLHESNTIRHKCERHRLFLHALKKSLDRRKNIVDELIFS